MFTFHFVISTHSLLMSYISVVINGSKLYSQQQFNTNIVNEMVCFNIFNKFLNIKHLYDFRCIMNVNFSNSEMSLII